MILLKGVDVDALGISNLLSFFTISLCLRESNEIFIARRIVGRMAFTSEDGGCGGDDDIHAFRSIKDLTERPADASALA